MMGIQPIPDQGIKKTNKFWLRCSVLLLLSGILFFGVYTSFNGLDRRSWFFSHNSKCNCKKGSFRFVEIFKDDNRSSEVDTQRVFYNRVPKCGSTTMLTLMQKLATRNGFVHVNSKVYHRKIASEEEQRRIVHWVKEKPPPCTFDKHVHFINFTKFGEEPPIYMNVIRDPVERIISSFFFRRVTARNNSYTNAGSKPSANWLNKKFHHCVLNHDSECSFVDGQNYTAGQLSFFCGQEPECQLFNDNYALQIAKRNIERFYAVVGVLEHMNETICVLEGTLPRFFKGAFKLYQNIGLHRNQNLEKQKVSEKVKLLLRGYLSAEYELYNFVVQRLHHQYQRLLIEENKTF